jgi:hypothetical protein
MRNFQFAPDNQGTSWGHAAGKDTISVAAVDYRDAPPFSANPIIPNQGFSSFGPQRHVFDTDGNPLPEIETLLKPDISGIDNVNTSFFGEDTDGDLLPNFTGTSAAAPNVAAIAALIRSFNPTVSASQVREALLITARPVNGNSAGFWDVQGGLGLIDGKAALDLFVFPPTPKIRNITPNPTFNAVDIIVVRWDQPVTGFDLTDVSLTRDGGPDLIPGSPARITTIDNKTFTIRSLKSLTSPAGEYVFSVMGVGAGITNPIGLEPVINPSVTFKKFDVPPPPTRPTDLVALGLSSTSVQLNWKDNSVFEESYTIQRATNEAFTQNVRTFRINSKDVTQFVDNTTQAATRYFYRVRASNISGNSPYSPFATVLTLGKGEVILDNNSPGVTVVGTWTSRDNRPGFIGTDFLDDGNNDQGAKSVTYTPNLGATTDYFIYARWTRAGDRATNAQYTIQTSTGPRIVLVDQRNRGGSGWVLLGKFTLSTSNASVTLSNTGADGTVIADAIRFLPSNPAVFG